MFRRVDNCGSQRIQKNANMSNDSSPTYNEEEEWLRIVLASSVSISEACGYEIEEDNPLVDIFDYVHEMYLPNRKTDFEGGYFRR